ncbi:hypothetical protein LSTR_LSTR016274 [Laodelphax striatellus]|uniref:Uncharacterized protein n=1 Tax=Laodelphax striatellus TaxID=195883 RepID=A0A482X861_LAOST|nr:hypothetical protein LSTR_LSTR016274 [Laodelphax striatellus]
MLSMKAENKQKRSKRKAGNGGPEAADVVRENEKEDVENECGAASGEREREKTAALIVAAVGCGEEEKRKKVLEEANCSDQQLRLVEVRVEDCLRPKQQQQPLQPVQPQSTPPPVQPASPAEATPGEPPPSPTTHPPSPPKEPQRPPDPEQVKCDEVQDDAVRMEEGLPSSAAGGSLLLAMRADPAPGQVP